MYAEDLSDSGDKGFFYAPLGDESALVGYPPISPQMAKQLQVTATVALCEIDRTPTDNIRPYISVKIIQCVQMNDGSAISLDMVRGFTAISHGPGPATWRRTSTDLITEILDLVRIDDPKKPGEHPWDELSEAAHQRGIDISADSLRNLPYKVILSDEVIDAFEI